MPAHRPCLHALLLLSLFSPATRAIDLRDYFPTPAGAIWMYSFSDWSTTGKCSGRRSVSVDTTVAGQLRLVDSIIETDCANVQAPVASTEILISGEAGQHLLSRGAVPPAATSYEWTPSMLVVPNRANVYQTFRSSGSVGESNGAARRDVSYQATLRLLGVEKLAVPAGSFPLAVHLQLVEVRAYPAPATKIELRTDRWLARSIGVLKSKTEVFVNGKVVQSSQWQLACSTLTDVQSVRCLPRARAAE